MKHRVFLISALAALILTSCESLSEDDKFIEFKDLLVEEICLTYYDIDRDRRLSFDEAAAAHTLLGFGGQDIVSFDELRYFTGLQVITNFCSCQKLKHITLPGNIKAISSSAFQDCISLQKIVIPDGVTTIGHDAFLGCTSLEDISLPNSISTIESRAFGNCSSLTDINLPNNIQFITSALFVNCTSLRNVVFHGDNITTIENNAFASCTSLTEMVLPNSVTKVGSGAFYNCSSIKSIIMNGVTQLNMCVVNKCPNLSSVSIDSIVSIAESAFVDCENLKSITLPTTIKFIGISALLSVDNIYCKAPTPPSAYLAFANPHPDMHIYVPTASVDAYKKAWGDHYDIIGYF